MEVPLPIKENLRSVLQTQMGGMFVENVCELYGRMINHHLPFRELGYNNLEAFLRSVPDVARLEYSVRERRMKVHGVAKFIFSMNVPSWQGPSSSTPFPNYQQQRQGKVMSDSHWNHEASAQGGGDGLHNIRPDSRGFYTLCFPAIKKPEEIVGTLEEMFGVAGIVVEVYESVRWIYVCYADLQSMQRAFKMFGHLGMKVATESALNMDRTKLMTMGGKKRKWEGPNQQPAPHNVNPRKRKKVSKGLCHRVYIGNLNPTVKYTFDMFRKLFHAYNITWITVKSSDGPDPKACAYILTINKQEAEKIVNEFNGYVWFGRPLNLHVKIKEAEKLKSEAGSLDTSRYGEGGSRHSSGKRGLVSDMPGLEPAMPRLESAMPGLESAMPGLESAMPGLEPAMPGLEPAMPGLEGMPGLESAMPGLEGMPGLESALPGLEPAMPGLEPILPPLEPALPPLEPALPPLEPAMPGLEPAMPGLEPVAAHALGQLPAKRSFEVPTVLATNFRNDIDEASLASLFAVYCPKAIRIASTHTGRKKAFIEVGSVEDVKQAVTNLNQSFYNGHRIKVDVPFNLPELRRAVLGYDRLQASATGTVTLSEVLKLRGHILQNLQLPAFTFHLGQQVEVLITAVISDKFFWGQIIDRRMAEELQKISDSLNEPCKSEMVMNGPGRCKAKFEGDGKWYRAWVMRSSSACVAPQCRVFYLDYGNTAHIPWSHTARTPDRWHWSQPPLAIPFTLIEAVPNLKDRELTLITVEVNALGNLEEGNMAVVRATSLVPSLKQSVSGLVRTIMM